MTSTEFRTTLEQLGLKQGQAAETLGLDIRTINRYANGAEIPKAVELALAALKRSSGKASASSP